MKRNLVIDDDIVENKTLYKKVNDIKKERENEKEKDLINKRKNNIISFFMILIIIGGINFLVLYQDLIMPKCLIKELNKLLF